MIHVETMGANGMPPTVMVFQVTVDRDHLEALLWSAGRMPDGQRSVPRHLRDALTVLLTPTATVAEPSSDAGTTEASSTSDTAAPTPSVRKSSRRRTLKDIVVEDDVDAVLT